jgi:A/G-specific adenine glycosylase
MHVAKLHEKIFGWWRSHGRVLPWREKSIENRTLNEIIQAPEAALRETAFAEYFAHTLRRDPYRVVVAEMMLQQTQVDRVLPKYETWMRRWPKIEDLAEVTLAEVLVEWQGLGYNRRARFLWLLAQEIVRARHNTWPTTETELLTLPGIGKYTARAIQVFAFGDQTGIVDTNIKRVIARLFGHLNLDGSYALSDKAFFEMADLILPAGEADPWHQALMDFGALICAARAPKCADCPVKNICQVNNQAQKNGLANFAEELRTRLQVAKTSPQKPKTRFEDTDRYFRGRIMDELRLCAQTTTNLQKILSDRYGLTDTQRFTRIIETLEKEGLLRVDKTVEGAECVELGS